MTSYSKYRSQILRCKYTHFVKVEVLFYFGFFSFSLKSADLGFINVHILTYSAVDMKERVF